MFIRHAGITRQQLVMCSVQIFAAKQLKTVRIRASSLEVLAAMCPSEHPFPATVPATHVAAAGAARGQGTGAATGSGHGRGRGRGCGGGAAARGPASLSGQVVGCASSSSNAGGKQRKRRRLPDSSDEEELSGEEEQEENEEEEQEEEEVEEEEEEDVPPEAPAGMRIVTWDQALDSFTEFILWTSVDHSPAGWHVGKVVRVLRQNRRDGFTYDAKLDGGAQLRGVVLSAAG
eukprot:6197729-Pleurochrysis_carterae.AAC.1